MLLVDEEHAELLPIYFDDIESLNNAGEEFDYFLLLDLEGLLLRRAERVNFLPKIIFHKG